MKKRKSLEERITAERDTAKKSLGSKRGELCLYDYKVRNLTASSTGLLILYLIAQRENLLSRISSCGAASVGEIKTKIWFYQTS